jgi:hypothetical protein
MAQRRGMVNRNKIRFLIRERGCLASLFLFLPDDRRYCRRRTNGGDHCLELPDRYPGLQLIILKRCV